MSSPSTMEKQSMTPNKVYTNCIVRKVFMRAILKTQISLNLSDCQKLLAFMSSFTMITHQIWSCHVSLTKDGHVT